MLKKAVFIALIAVTFLALLTSCGGGEVITTLPTTNPPTTAPPTTSPTTAPPTTTADTMDADSNVAVKMVDFLYNLEAVQNYYNDGMTAMATFQVQSSAKLTHALVTNGKVPQEFMDKLPAGGAMPAPAGACPAAAEPKVTFKTKADEAVTPEMILEKNIETIPDEYVTMAQELTGSLVSRIENMVNRNDQRLGTAQGWNDLLWDNLSDLFEPVESLMGYQLWTAAPEIETDIADLYYERLVSYGVPQIVLDAYKASNTHGWFANQTATEEDELARMDIEAELTGSFEGTVYEQRDFTIEGAGQTPTYGLQTGDGIVTWNLPDNAGAIDMSVDINLDQFDEMGRAVGGVVVADAIDYEGYQVVFTFLPDGGKNGEVFKDGVKVGYLTMTVDHSEFTNYVDVKSGAQLPIPEDVKPK